MSKIPYAHIWAYAPNLIDFKIDQLGHKFVKYQYYLIETNLIQKVSLNLAKLHILDSL